NADDRVVRSYASRTAASVVLFGVGGDAVIHAQRLTVGTDDGIAEFELVTPGGSAPVRLPAPGEHLVPDALAAAAVGWVLGAALIAVGAEREGFERDRIVVCEDVDEAARAVRALAAPGDVVLVKASRVERLERVAEALRGTVPLPKEIGA